jgi:hypothetical protein
MARRVLRRRLAADDGRKEIAYQFALRRGRIASMSGSYVMENLRRRILDESESLPGLLRTCLMLSAETGSDALRAWASSELHGYETPDGIPAYRQLQLPLYASGWIGGMHRSEFPIEFWRLPEEAQEVLKAVPFQQSIEELEGLARGTDSLRYVRDGLLLGVRAAKGLPFTQLEEAYCLVAPAAIAGMVGKVRTTLVEMVADMTRDVPFDGLPTRRQVDSAVQVNLYGSQDQYHVKVGTNNGLIGQGAGSTQSQRIEGASHDLVGLLEQLRVAAAAIEDDDDRSGESGQPGSAGSAPALARYRALVRVDRWGLRYHCGFRGRAGSHRRYHLGCVVVDCGGR